VARAALDLRRHQVPEADVIPPRALLHIELQPCWQPQLCWLPDDLITCSIDDERFSISQRTIRHVVAYKVFDDRVYSFRFRMLRAIVSDHEYRNSDTYA